MSAHHEIQQLPGKNTWEQRMCAADILTTLAHEGKILSICCTTGEFLLVFQMTIITANLFLVSFTNC
jgi:hypothetical protein